MKIGFIGVGVMGIGMVRNLLKNNFEVNIFSRTKSKSEIVVKDGAVWKDSIKECIEDADVVITMVGFPKDVENVYFGKDGIIENAKENAIIIDMTTTEPNLSVKIYEAAKEKNIHALDAPVSGGDAGAKNGTLSIMVGGDKEIFERAHGVFEAMGTTIVYEGKAGFGQHTKMVNQIVLGGTIAAVCEGIKYSEKIGLDMQTVLDSISKGAASSWQLSNQTPKIMNEDFAPGFYIKHYVKDLMIANNNAALQELQLPILRMVLDMYKSLEASGSGDLGTQALIKYYE